VVVGAVGAVDVDVVGAVGAAGVVVVGAVRAADVLGAAIVAGGVVAVANRAWENSIGVVGAGGRNTAGVGTVHCGWALNDSSVVKMYRMSMSVVSRIFLASSMLVMIFSWSCSRSFGPATGVEGTGAGAPPVSRGVVLSGFIGRVAEAFSLVRVFSLFFAPFALSDWMVGLSWLMTTREPSFCLSFFDGSSSCSAGGSCRRSPACGEVVVVCCDIPVMCLT
jgi:hypothetical protein